MGVETFRNYSGLGSILAYHGLSEVVTVNRQELVDSVEIGLVGATGLGGYALGGFKELFCDDGSERVSLSESKLTEVGLDVVWPTYRSMHLGLVVYGKTDSRDIEVKKHELSPGVVGMSKLFFEFSEGWVDVCGVVVVRPEYRRRGLGEALTMTRDSAISWVLRTMPEIFYDCDFVRSSLVAAPEEVSERAAARWDQKVEKMAELMEYKPDENLDGVWVKDVLLS